MREYCLCIFFISLIGGLQSCNPTRGVLPVSSERNLIYQMPPVVRGLMVSRTEFVNKKTLIDLKNWGANVIRLQILPARYAVNHHKDIWQNLPEYLDLVKQRVDWAKTLGLWVVIDLHEPPVLKDGALTSASYWGTDEFWNRADLKPAFISVWKAIAEKFKSDEYDSVIWAYDIYNEPQQKSSIPHKWRAMAPEIIAAIRKVEPDRWIVYEPGPWGGAGGYVGLVPLDDKRIIYSMHMYEPQETFTHQGVYFPDSVTTFSQAVKFINKPYPGNHNGKYWDKETLRKSLQPVRDFQLKYNVPVYAGEFSVIRWAPVQSSVQWLTDVIDIFEEYGWSWSYHAFREWHGWSLEHREGPAEFWYKGDPDAPVAAQETERAKVFRRAFLKNKK